MMKKEGALRFLFIAVFFVFISTAITSGQAVLVHNSIEDIEACQGKIKLELVRIWGGDKEDDENKFFNFPLSMAIDEKNALIYILDQMEHCVKVFKSSGEYVRTIGQRGKGPGDLYSPFTVSLAPSGDIIVFELGSSRIQRFSPEGKSKKIIKIERQPLAQVYGITSKDEIVFYNVDWTLKTKKLVSILDYDGKVINWMFSSWYCFTINFALILSYFFVYLFLFFF